MKLFSQDIDSAAIVYDVKYDEPTTVLDVSIRLKEDTSNTVLSHIAIDLTQCFEAHSMIDIYLRKTATGYPAFAGVYKNSEATWSKEDKLFKQILYTNLGLPVITIYQNETVADTVVYLGGEVNTELDCTVIANTDPKIATIKLTVPWIEELQTKMVRRNDFVSNISTANSVAYLEVQVDFLTKALQILLNNNPDSLSALQMVLPSWDTFMNKSIAASVMSVKSVDSCISELDNKEAIRQLQQQYIQTKGTALSANAFGLPGVTIS